MKDRNNAMIMDMYELTMGNAYFIDDKKDDIALFDVFYRKNPDNGGFAILAGILPVIDFIDSFHFNKDDIDYLKSLNRFDHKFLDYIQDTKFDIEVTGLEEGTIIYPNTPLLTIKAPLIFGQLLETYILTLINHQSLIATKANRLVRAANGKSIADFGARRAHGGDAAIYGARAAYIGGVNSTATVMAGELYNEIPITGTMAHSFIQSYDSELEAFQHFAAIETNNCILLIDTIDTLKSGIINAIKTFKILKELNNGVMPKNYGVRIDSGDLAFLSKEVRKKLDDAGFNDAKIVVSNSLTEDIIKSLIQDQKAPIDSFGVGENLITAKSDAVFGAVYKLVGMIDKESGNIIPKIKISNNPEKITNPGRKYLLRAFNKNSGYAIGDILTDKKDISQENFACINSDTPYTIVKFGKDIELKQLSKVLYKRVDGKVIEDIRSSINNLNDIREYVKKQLESSVYPEILRFENPYRYPLYYDLDYYNMKIHMLMNATSKDSK